MGSDAASGIMGHMAGVRVLLDDMGNTRLPQWLSGKESACSTGASGVAGLIPGSGRSPRGGHGNPLQYSCLENPQGQKRLAATVHGAQRVGHNWGNLVST